MSFPHIWIAFKYTCVCAQSLFHVQMCGPTACSLPGSSVRGTFQTRKLQCRAISYTRSSSQPRDLTCVCCISCIGRQILHHGTTRDTSAWLHMTVGNAEGCFACFWTLNFMLQCSQLTVMGILSCGQQRDSATCTHGSVLHEAPLLSGPPRDIEQASCAL